MVSLLSHSRFLPIALLFAALSSTAAARAQSAPAVQPAFQAVPAAEAPQYRFDFGKDFFSSDAAYQAALAQLNAEANQIQSYQGKLLASPENLYTVLKLSDDFTVRFERIYNYLDLKYSTNTKDTADHDAAVRLDTALSPKLAYVPVELEQITPAQEQRFFAAEPRLKGYAYAIADALRSKPHTLSAGQESLLSAVSPLMTSWESDEYDLLMDRAPWGKVRDPETGAEWDVRQDEGQIDNSPVRDVRIQGAHQETAAYKSESDLFAFDVINIAKSENALARLRHFKNGQDAAFFNLYLTYPQIDTAYEQILSHGGLNKQYQTLHRARIAQFTGYPVVHYYDSSVVPPGVVKPRFTIDQARTVIEASTQYLGPEWNRELDNLLNPANGRLDIVPGENRVPNAFTDVSPGRNAVFYSYGYEGYLGDVVTLAHESGHAVHNGLQNNAHILTTYSDGPRYFTESYAILDQFVLEDSLYRKETDPGRKVYYLEYLLSDLLGFYGSARIAAIEKGIYEGVDDGSIKDADSLTALTHRISSRTSIWSDIDPETNDLWQLVPHYYSSPTYYVNYVFADLLAETYFSMYKKDPTAFGKRFTALERNGFNDTPAHLLKRFLNIDMQDPKTYAAVFAQQQQYLTELQGLYAQVPVPKAAGQTASLAAP